MIKQLFIDIETSPNLAYVWDKWEQNVIAFEKERELISYAYKWKGGKVKSVCLGDCNEKKLVKGLHELFDQADVIIAQNGDEFDIKMANAFFIKQGLTPPKPYKTIDTLKIARSKFRFNSNKLNDLGEYLGLGKKLDTGGFGLWLRCIKGDKKAWRLMKRYNEQDVVLLEKIYDKLVPWATNTPYMHDGMVCQKCGGNIQFRGPYITKTQIGKRYQCQSCGSWGISNKHLNIKTEYIK